MAASKSLRFADDTCLQHLSHPHIVSYLSSFSTTYYHCLVLENLSGGELFDLLQTPGNHRRMGEDLIRRVFGELCRGVYWLHEAKVVHRDLKLESEHYGGHSAVSWF